jgi:hypothetical protein
MPLLNSNSESDIADGLPLCGWPLPRAESLRTLQLPVVLRLFGQFQFLPLPIWPNRCGLPQAEFLAGEH